MISGASPALSISGIQVAKEEGWELSQPLNSSKAVVVGGNAPRQLLSLRSIHVFELGECKSHGLIA